MIGAFTHAAFEGALAGGIAGFIIGALVFALVAQDGFWVVGAVKAGAAMAVVVTCIAVIGELFQWLILGAPT
ncbi:MAG: hypothetical protein AAGF30_00530 [Pseudomonadota bacterium]